MAQFRMALLDLDGTILRPDSALSARSIQAVHNANARGCVMVLASARAPRTMLTYYEKLELKTPMVAYNGALVVNASGDTLYHQPLAAQVAQAAVAAIRRFYPDANVGLECNNTWHVDRLDEALLGALERYRIAPPDSQGRVHHLLDAEEPVTKILIPHPGEERLDAFARSLGSQVYIAGASDLLEIVAEGVTKGAACARLAREWQIPSEAVVAFGNDYNDIPMFEFAGLSIAVSNAPPAVQAIAGRVTLSNAEDGVAIALEQLMRDSAI